MSVSQLKPGFCVSQYWNHPTVIGKGAGPVVPFEVVVPARPNRLAPGSSPYHRCFPSTIQEFTGLDPATDEAALRAQTRLVHEWRRFPFLDPRLPAQLLPDSWRGAKAADLFHTRHADWHPAAQRHWERLTADAGAS